MTPTERVLAALRDHGHEPKRAGAGWTSRCPAHDDRNPSLSINVGEDGRALVNCHAGCSTDAVCGAIGLRVSDLFPPDPSGRNGRTPKPRRRSDGDGTAQNPALDGGFVAVAGDATPHSRGRTFPTARDAVAELEWRLGQRSAAWTYHDAAGEPVGLVVRWNTPTGKDVRPVSRKADGSGWVIGGMPTQGGRPLYALPDLLATRPGDRVYVCEGEKAADAARAIGLIATTSPHGSKSASKADWSPVSGREVVIVPDHDHAGKLYAADVARLATAAGAKSVRIIRLADLWAEMPEGGDIVDLIEHRGGDVDAIRVEVEALADAVESESIEPDAPAVGAFKPFPVDALPRSMCDYIRQTAARMDADPVLIVAPTLSIFAGAIGNAARVIVKHGWIEPSCLWTGVVALPGSMKSQTQAAAAAPMHDAQRSADADHGIALTEYQSAKAEHDAAKKPRGKGGAGAPTVPEPEEPKRWQCLTQDATPESLVGVLSNNPRGVVNLWDELAGFFGGFARYSKGGANGGEPGAAFYKSAYTGTTHIENRKGPDGKGRYVRLECPLVSVTGGIQPEALKRVLLPQYLDDGLASRFLWAWPPDQPGGWVDDDGGDDAAERRYAETFRRLLGVPLNVDPFTGALKPAFVGLRREAESVAKGWVEGVRTRVRHAANPAIRAAWAKLKGGAFRIALVLHLTEWAERGGGYFGAIEPDTLRRAVRIAEWFGQEAERVYGMLSESDEDRETRRLVEWIDRGGKNREPGTATVRDLTRGPSEYRNNPEGAAKALDGLVAAGLAVWVHDDHGPKGGRPADRIRLLSRSGNPGDGDETPETAERCDGSVASAADSVTTDSDEARWPDGSPITIPDDIDASKDSVDEWGSL
jgi:hypothetical protein